MTKSVFNLPPIHFRNDDEHWKKGTLNDAVVVNSGQDYKHLSEGDIPVFGTGGLMLTVNEALSFEDAVGIGRKGTIDKPMLLKAPFWTVDTLYYCLVSKKFDLNFIFNVFQSIDWKSKDESTGVPSLSKTAIIESEFNYPSLPIQQKIGLLLSEIDSLIQNQKKKRDSIIQLKQALLQNIIPNVDESPSIYFNQEKWEMKSIGKISKTLTGYPFPSDLFSDEGIMLIRGVNVKRGFIDKTDSIMAFWPSTKDLEDYILNQDDILVQMDGALIGQSFAILNEKDLPALLVQRVTRIRVDDNIDSYFVYATIQKNFLSYIRKKQTSTSIPHLSLSDVDNFPIMVPTYKTQQKIGLLFRAMDETINNLNNILMSLERFAKALSQGMIV